MLNGRKILPTELKRPLGAVATADRRREIEDFSLGFEAKHHRRARSEGLWALGEPGAFGLKAGQIDRP